MVCAFCLAISTLLKQARRESTGNPTARPWHTAKPNDSLFSACAL